MKPIYIGKAKDVYITEKQDELLIRFKDDATASNGKKHALISGKAKLNNLITEHIFKYLIDQGVATHFIRRINEYDQLVKKAEIIPLEIIVRNIAAGSFARNFGVPIGTKLINPTFEISYKKDELNDPLLNKDHAIALGIINDHDYEHIKSEALKINDLLKKYFLNIGIILVDFKLEFGYLDDGKIVLIDEFSPDNSRLWDIQTNQSLDKDNFRQEKGSLIDAYTEVIDRIENGYERPLHEECGVVAIFGINNAPEIAYSALHAIQHRGQNGAGISWNENNKIMTKKGNGLLDWVFGDADLTKIHSNKAIGHVRYATMGNLDIKNIHPFVFDAKHHFALAHNGNISNAPELRKKLIEQNIKLSGESDSEMVGMMIANEDRSFLEALNKTLDKLEGAFSFVFLDDKAIYAARDKIGFRPLALGKLNDCYVIASETVAFDIIGAKFIRDVKPGEVIKIDQNGVTSHTHSKAPDKVKLDAMELIYFARPDSIIDGVRVHNFRKLVGAKLAKEAPAPEGQIVVPVPESSYSAALGYSQISGLPMELGIVKNQYISRTFIQAEQTHRETSVKRKLNASSIVKGKNVVLIDDSIVRGTTIKKVVEMLRLQGAKRVDVRVASPMVIAPSYYGINISTYGELIATRHNHNIKEIVKEINADSIGFVSVDGMRACAPELDLEMCIFEDKYPTFVSPELIKEAKYEK